MSSNSILRITDCISPVDFLSIDDGFLVCDWIPTVAQLKNGGVWQSSPLVDGKRLASRNFDNAVETFTLTIKGASQDAVINYIQSLTTMLEKAVAYWTTSWQKQPVWIEARGATESKARYAVIKGYKIEELANPFSQPFFGNCKSLISKFILVIERDHWIDQFPGTALCINLNNQQEFIRVATTTITSSPQQTADDAMLASSEATVTLNSYCAVGRYNEITYESGMRFPNITIPQGATILDAYLTVLTIPSDDAAVLTMGLMGELVPNAPVFSSSINEYYQRKSNHTLTTQYFTLPIEDWSSYNVTKTFSGLHSVIQEIVNQYGWASGNALVLFAVDATSASVLNATRTRKFQTLETGTTVTLTIVYRNPQLTTFNVGRDDTCIGNVYVSNKHAQAQLTHIFYNDNGTGFSGNLIGTALPWTLLPAVPANGDEIYFGISASDTPYAGIFNGLAFDIAIKSAGFTLAWYHSLGGGIWGPSTAYSDGSADLAQVGEYSIQFSDYDEELDTVNGVNGQWMKAVVTATGATTPPQQQNREIYSPIVPYVDIDGDDIKGEISALARIRVSASPSVITTDETTNLIIGSRSKSRGEDFTPYLNYSTHNAPGISLTNPAALVNDIRSPTGQCSSMIIPIGDEIWHDSPIQIVINNSVSRQYHGAYHAYLRFYSFCGGTDIDLDLRLMWSNLIGINSYSPIFHTYSITLGTAWSMLLADFGIIELGSYLLTNDENIGNIIFTLQYRNSGDGTCNLYLYDLVLMPCDEWFGAYHSNSNTPNSMLRYGKLLDVDAIGSPRSSRSVLRLENSGEPLVEDYITEWSKSTRGGPYLQHNADQRLWFLAYSDSGVGVFPSYAHNNFKVRLYSVNRYLTMKGNA